jgi:serine/threonine-protein kinase
MTIPVTDPEMTARVDDVRPTPKNRGSDGQFTPGTIIAGRYRISGILGAGGMGEVYRADDTRLNQPVALKFLPARLAHKANLLARLGDEVRLGRQIAHPNVCRIYDIVDWEGAHFAAMEYVDGEDLERLLRRIGRISHDKAVDIARDVAAGLAAAHHKGILHRDLKPANVMIDSHGDARIMDFGIALAAGDDSQNGVIAGTPAYMAPEQFTGQPATIQSDLYALGLVMYELFTGKRAHNSCTLQERLSNPPGEIATPSSLIRDIDPSVERIILRCLSADPSQRPRSAREVIDALPGGDPLAAAMAAGETPLPGIVAAAGTEGTLKPAVALSLLAVIIVLLATLLALAWARGVQRMIHLDKPPEVQLEQARTLLRQLGIPRQAYASHGFVLNKQYQAWVYTHDDSSRRFERFARGLPLMSFWLREQDEPLLRPPPDSPQPAVDSPPQSLPGASTIEVDPRGRIVSLAAIAAPSWKPRALDWRPLFTAAGLDLSAFTPATPRLIPTSAADARAAWSGRHPEDGTPIRVEAGAWRGVPVFFRVVAPWDEVDESSRVPFGGGGFDRFLMICMIFAMAGGALLAWRNLRLDRGDQQGAVRLGWTMFIVCMTATLASAEHRVNIAYEGQVLLGALADALFWAVVTALAYIAVEPPIRRRWPDRLIGWARLFGGSWRDPMVGRDILFGLIGGLLYSAIAPKFRVNELTMLDRVRAPVALLAGAVRTGVVYGLTVMFVLMLLTFVLRRRRYAAAGVFAMLMLAFALVSREPAILARFAVMAALLIFVLVRFGLLANVAFQTAFYAIFYNPFPDAFDWYTARGLIAPLLILAFAVWAFRTSLGDQKLFVTDEL